MRSRTYIITGACALALAAARAPAGEPYIGQADAAGSIVITATRSATEIESLAVPVMVISRADIERSLDGDLAALLRRADIYTAKLSSRSTRSALAANRAGREIFMQDPGHPMNNAIVKEFGVYPPGCFVRLACGETGVVIKRGPSANTPIVASLTDRRGEPLAEPLRRDTAVREHLILDVVGEHTLRVRVPPEKLAMMAAA